MGDIAKDDRELSAAMAVMVKRALLKDPARNHALVHDITGASIRGISLGSWRITVEPRP